MKKAIHPRRPLVAIAASLVLLSAPAHAVFIAINAPTTSYSSIAFNDTASVNPSNVNGVTNTASLVTSWSGALNSYSGSDPNTLDVGQGDMSATFAGTSYNVWLNNVLLTHQSGNTGHAVLSFRFRVEYQVDNSSASLGIAPQATISPVFAISGNVGTKAGAYAQLTGQIDYFVTGTALPVDTVTYSWSQTGAGPFSNPAVTGTAAVGTTPFLSPGTTLTLEGYFDLLADPTTISLQTIPEPGSAGLLLLGASGLLLRRKRAEG